MKERNCKSLEEFLKRADEDFPPLTGPFAGILPMQYRGQPNSKFRLETTLERFSEPQVPLREYFRFVNRSAPELWSFSNRDWKVPQALPAAKSVPDLWKQAREYFSALIYLRHYGAPSPLLDWSRSPYVAAYFAFADPGSAESVAIFCYRDPEKAYWAYDAKIHVIDPAVSQADKRHYVQQSCYTMCLKAVSDDPVGGNVAWASHEDDHESGVRKYVLPVSIRREVLGQLQKMNINAYTLFGSEEGLVKHLALKHLFVELN